MIPTGSTSSTNSASDLSLLPGDVFTDRLPIVRIEHEHYRSWLPFGPERVFQQAEARLAQEGWDSVRPALSGTVRFGYQLAGRVSSLANENVLLEIQVLGFDGIPRGRGST